MGKYVIEQNQDIQCKLRLALMGPSGSGKTYTALRIASGIAKKILVIDSEAGSAWKAARTGGFKFDMIRMKPDELSVADIVGAMAEASAYDAIVIDSLTHCWETLVAEVDKITDAKYKGNNWRAWSDDKGNPEQKRLIHAIIWAPQHVIATMRVKTDWQTQQNAKTGRTEPVRIGLKPEQGKSIEYEFDMLMELNTDHVATVLKDRTGKYQDHIIKLPDEKFGAALGEWLGQGTAPMAPPEAPRSPQAAAAPAQAQPVKTTPAATGTATGGVGNGHPVTKPEAAALIAKVTELLAALVPPETDTEVQVKKLRLETLLTVANAALGREVTKPSFSDEELPKVVAALEAELTVSDNTIPFDDTPEEGGAPPPDEPGADELADLRAASPATPPRPPEPTPPSTATVPLAAPVAKTEGELPALKISAKVPKLLVAARKEIDGMLRYLVARDGGKPEDHVAAVCKRAAIPVRSLELVCQNAAERLAMWQWLKSECERTAVAS